MFREYAIHCLSDSLSEIAANRAGFPPAPVRLNRRIRPPMPETQYALNVFLPLWGLLWGCYFKLLVVAFEMAGNTAQNARREDTGPPCRKLLTVRNIAQGLGTFSNPIRTCILMERPGC